VVTAPPGRWLRVAVTGCAVPELSEVASLVVRVWFCVLR